MKTLRWERMMYKIAFIYGDTLIYWNAVVMALAVLTGVVFFWAAYCRKSGDFAEAAVAAPVAIILSLLLSRFAHWYFRPDSYESLAAAMTDLSGTGFALLGAFAGCLLTASLLRLMGTISGLPRMLDSMSIGGSVAIALGRLSFFFTADDRGEILATEHLPWAYPVMNTATGLPEYRLAVFLFQALAAGVIFVVLLGLHYTGKGKKRRDGDLALLFLLLYCAVQIVLDSVRYDSLHLRSNGFISAVQILCALALAVVAVIFTVRGWKRSAKRCAALDVAILASLICCGFMEYLVQRRGDRAAAAYGVMSACLAIVVLAGAALYRLGSRAGQPE